MGARRRDGSIGSLLGKIAAIAMQVRQIGVLRKTEADPPASPKDDKAISYNYSVQRLKTSEPLVPPKPKEFERA